MKYTFNIENRERMQQFNKEKLLLAAVLEPEQLYYLMDTHYDGIYQTEANDRRREIGPNALGEFAGGKKEISDTLNLLYEQKVAVMRRKEDFFTEISCEDLVPGDVIFISQGDIVPGDLRVIFSHHLMVDQSLYGRDRGIQLKASSYPEEDLEMESILDLPDICFTGTSIVEGSARGVIISTGLATFLGHLFLMGRS